MNWLLEKLLGIDKTVSANGDWHIVWRSAPDAWLLFLIIIPAVLLFTYLIYRKERTTTTTRSKFFLSALRSAIILIVLLMLFQPAAVVEKPITRESTLAVLIDDSLSMNLKDRYSVDAEVRQLMRLTSGISATTATSLREMGRIEIVNAILSNQKIGIIAKLQDKSKLKLYTFSAGLKPLANGSGDLKVSATGDGTALGNALGDLVNDLGGHALGGVVLISDGQNNLGREPIEAVNSLKQSGRAFPIYTVLAGTADKHKDIELSELSAPQVGLVLNDVAFNFTIKGIGLAENQNIKITLSERKAGETQSNIVAEETVKLVSPDRFPMSIKYKPSRVGDYIYEIRTPLLDGETIEENNFLEHYLKVVDNTIRVLYVDTYPRWEYRRLKNALIRDRTAKASMFLVSADPDFPQDSSNGVTPLAEFPTEPKDLFNYDVIIWGDVNPEYLVSGHTTDDKLLANVRRFVEEMGGGLAFICGERFNPNSFRKTAFADLMPLIMEDSDYMTQGRFSGNITESFRLKLTPEGLADPIIRLEDNPADNNRLWETMPGFYWYHPFKKAKPAARVLATHPMVASKSGLRPIMATQYYGAGRVFLSATDETWRWCSVMPIGKQANNEKYFYGFWSNVLRFLRGGRLLGSRRVQLSTDRPGYAPGEQVKITAKLYDPEFKPLKQPSYTVSLSVIPAKAGIQESTSEQAVTLNAIPDKEGQYEGVFTPASPGFYKIVPSSLPLPRGERVGEGETGEVVFSVHYARREYEKPLPNPELLQNIAKATDGAFLKLTEIGQLPAIVKPISDVIYSETKEDDIWDKPFIFILFLLIISVEWIIRKLVGLI
ncbi:MAG: hypothetical protein HZA49_04495 [Planctomycetes bacterium]|nr:hypothetical protein [Planctomycetota bacterium]